MIINKDEFKYLRQAKNSIYDDIKIEFLYHSNKLEGSTFNIEQLNMIIDENKIVGEHTIDDVQETINSLKLFDFVIDTLDEELTPRLLKEFHLLLKRNTRDEEYGFAGIFKKIPNKLRGVNMEVAQPYEVPEKIEELLKKEIESIEDIAEFHSKFEKIHPFQDGNGRIGRFIILRQCIKAELDLIAIDNEFNKEYKDNLYIAQTTNNYKPLINTLKNCQERLDEKYPKIDETLKIVRQNLQEDEDEEEPEM